jgi:hypothetical protein
MSVMACFQTRIIYSYENGFIPQAHGGSSLSFSQDQPLKRGSILRGNQHMNRAFHSVALAAALFLSTAFTSPATHEPSAATMTTQRFEFVSNGNRLSGFVDVPAGGAARAMIVIIHGYGKTDVAGRTSYYDLRSRFTQLGISTLLWDKPGCGESKGTFDAGSTGREQR